MSEKGDLVRRLFKAVEARDAAAVVSCYADDVEIHEAESLPYGGVYRGRDGALRHWERVIDAWRPFQRDLRTNLSAVFVDGDGDTVAVLFRARGINASGDRFEAPEVGIYQVRDRRIVRSQMFHADTASVVRFLAGEGAGHAAATTHQRTPDIGAQ
jgi:ketosteroid isomerase-like protein